mgnify:CR=1 FL=1
MSCQHLTLACAASAMLLCGSAHAEFITDRKGDLDLAPAYIEIFVDEFSPGGTSPTTWSVRDGELSPYHPQQKLQMLGIPFGELAGRITFWVPRSQPTFYLEGWTPPFPDEYLGDRGLTFHTLDVEALAGADYVTIDPSNVPGRFTYIWTGGSRTVDLTVLPRAPEPSSLMLAAVAALGVWRRKSFAS